MTLRIKEWQRLAHQQKLKGNSFPISLIMCDVDFFKNYNTVYGHLGGDDCLKQVAQIIKQGSQRATDLAARYGGEEFAVILPNTDQKGALTVANKIRSDLHKRQIPHTGSSVSNYVTLSIQKYDYSKLIKLLASQQWEKADQETAAKMIEIIEGEKDELKTKDIKKFPVNQLEEIDKLWIHYSNGKFGFSVQQYIWTQLGGQRGEFESDIYKKWAKKVGWRANSSWKKYDELEFTINAPIGHLPAVTLAWSSWGAAWCGDETVKLFSRLNYNSSTAEPQNKQDQVNISEGISKIKSDIDQEIKEIKGGIIDIGNILNNFKN